VAAVVGRGRGVASRLVAQSCTLLYRRVLLCRVWANPRCRLQVGGTAEWNSALL